MDLKIKNFFKNNKIENVLFDMDNTLMDTDIYYQENMINTTQEVVEITLNIPEEKQVEMAKEIYSFARKIFIENGLPVLIDNRTKEVIEAYFKTYNILYDEEKISNHIKQSYKDFYKTAPLIFPSTLDKLHSINELGIKIGVYSHAQHDWTEIKIEKIKDEYKKKYNKEIVLPFFTTEITNLKDYQGWKKAGEYHSFILQNTLVVGDSLTSDIYPAIEAGYMHLIYLSHGREVPEFKTISKVYITNDISTLFSFL